MTRFKVTRYRLFLVYTSFKAFVVFLGKYQDVLRSIYVSFDNTKFVTKATMPAKFTLKCLIASNSWKRNTVTPVHYSTYIPCHRPRALGKIQFDNNSILSK